jgi:hypothetical protein
MAEVPALSGMLQTADDVLAAVRARKDDLNLSDAAVDHLAGYANGRWGKAFGPAREKNPTVVTLMLFADVLGVSFVMVEDPAKVRRMKSRWEGRRGRVPDASKIASSAIRRALPAAIRQLTTAGGKARWQGIDADARRAHMTELARKRWAA